MEIITHKDYHSFLNFLPAIKGAAKEWQLVDVRLADDARRYNIQQIAAIMLSVFKDKKGKIYIGNEQSLCMLVSSGHTPDVVSKKIEDSLPGGACRVSVSEANAEGLKKLELFISPKPAAAVSAFSSARFNRNNRVVLVADDDMYIRTLVKKGVQPHAEIHEIVQGDEVPDAYKKYMPDMLLLDIHLPGKTGLELLQEILSLDPEAYIVMLSADSSQENVLNATQNGAKGFMAKPFNKDKLIGYMKAAHIC